ncbi:hypothetical protein [Geopsychrobacter electrodiphilus]|uniref:hypothetical protein n=1 Tax=Geopsychrobacter electrodiphilus TaxID=225196 RepID=UPI000366FD4E|nr:hypothetical protein [Geopsychrobacter electrodiphilus]
MLGLNVTVQGDKIILSGLRLLTNDIDPAAARGLAKAAKGSMREAHKFLSGAGGKPGSYPVPVETGHLRRMLNWLKPGVSKTADGETFTTGKLEAMVYDSAIYSNVIHDGTGSSSKFGARPFITDGFERFNQTVGVANVIEDEIAKAIAKRGFK